MSIRPAFPSAQDLKPGIEPEYPLAALDPGQAGKDAEDAWWNKVLIWGRGEHGKVQRVCRWAVELKMDLPAGYCDDPHP